MVKIIVIIMPTMIMPMSMVKIIAIIMPTMTMPTMTTPTYNWIPSPLSVLACLPRKRFEVQPTHQHAVYIMIII